MTVEELLKLDSSEIVRRRYNLATEMSLYDAALEKLRETKKIHRKSSDIEWKDHALDQSMNLRIKTASVIAPELGFSIYSMRAFIGELPPKSSEGAYHRHGEAIKYYLSGRAVEIVGDEEYEVGAGDFVFIPANIWHGTQNPYDEPVRFIAVAQPPDVGTRIPTLYMRKESE